jgi:hypothetical protein
MRRLLTMIAAVLLVLPLVAGCAQKKTETASNQAPPAEQATPVAGEAMKVAGQSLPPADMALTAMTLEGKVGCGHCTYHTTDACALAMQTEDGKVYVIESAPDYDTYFGDRFSGKQMKVSGKVGEKDGKWLVFAEQVEVR